MKKIRLFFSILLFFSIAAFSIILLTKDNDSAQASNWVYISDKTLALELGHYKTLRVYGTSQSVSWSSSNNWIASVSSGGKVTAKAAGSATITASVAGKRLTCKLTVIRINKKALTLTPGDTSTLTITGTNSDVDWASNDVSVATVTNSGQITALSPGTAAITAYVDGKEITCNITVIGLNYKALVLNLGDSSASSKTLKINDITSTVTWSTNNKSVAAVSSSGKVTAKGIGTAAITARVGEKKLISKVTVIKMNQSALTLTPGDTSTITVSTGTDSDITWSSSDKSNAVVSDNGQVRAVSPGNATITASYDDNSITCNVIVIDINYKKVSLELGSSSGYKQKLRIYNTSNKITWSSSDESVAAVTSYGTVKAKGTGSATITASVGGITLSSKVTVIQMSTKEFTLGKGETKRLEVYGTTSDVVWLSSNHSIAKVSDNGTVNPVSAGTASIIAYVDGNIIRAKVTVLE